MAARAQVKDPEELEDPAAMNGRAEDSAPEPGSGSEAGEAPIHGAPEDPEGDEEILDGRLGPGEELSDEELARRAAVLLFVSPEPLTLRRIVDLLERPRVARVRAALAAFQERLEGLGLPFGLDRTAGRFRFLSAPDLAEVVQRLQKEARPERITQAALETLAIVAYRQPVTTAEVDAIRGVQSGAMLRSLVDRDLVKVVGRADQPGSPLQYGTTREFLERFGLGKLGELPRDSELAGG